METTRTPAFGQLEKNTRAFRGDIANSHRAKEEDARARALVALDRWEPEPDEPVWVSAPRPKRKRGKPLHHDREVVNRETGEIRDIEDAPASCSVVVRAIVEKAVSTRLWHRNRRWGQLKRFRTLEQCGNRVMIAKCMGCSAERQAVPEGCGIARLCEKCSLRNAKRRRARFGRARARVALELARVGFTRKKRKDSSRTPGGRWSDKMITLTLPHFLFCEVERDAAIRTAGAIDATMARIWALRLAWPLFARTLGAWFKRGGTMLRRKRGQAWVPRMPIGVPLANGTFAPPPMHRAFEWTLGGDKLGHPHFHLWTLAPYVPRAVIERLWGDALREVGCPMRADDYVRVKIQNFRSFDRNAVGELIKSGNGDSFDAAASGGMKKAIEWSRLYKKGPQNAFEYADGWTIRSAADASDDVRASLYKALEGARLTQASRGFFDADEPPSCTACKVQGCWHVRFEPIHPEKPARDPERSAIVAEEQRGPP